MFINTNRDFKRKDLIITDFHFSKKITKAKQKQNKKGKRKKKKPPQPPARVFSIHLNIIYL